MEDVKTIIELEKCAADLAKKFLKSRKKGKQATVLALSGDLGSGKTTFTSIFAKRFGITERILSPTFIIERVYSIRNGRFKKFIHIDAYRFKNHKEIFALGWEGLIADPRNIICVEWAEKVKPHIPKDALWIYFKHVSENKRKIILRNPNLRIHPNYSKHKYSNF